jgi:hypothetical protein
MSYLPDLYKVRSGPGVFHREPAQPLAAGAASLIENETNEFLSVLYVLSGVFQPGTLNSEPLNL